MNIEISLQPIVIAEEHQSIAGVDGAGAVVVFSGQVRKQGTRGDLVAMELEHYPGMTEACIANFVQEAVRRWQLLAVRVVHRVGRLLPGETIVLVAVAAQHRAEAFAAAEFIMDYLKNRAPFWKKEFTDDGAYWVEQKVSDVQALERW